MQHGLANMLRPGLGKGEAEFFLGGHRVLGGRSSRIHSEHINQFKVFR